MPGSEKLWSVQAGKCLGMSAFASSTNWSNVRSSRLGIGRGMVMLRPNLGGCADGDAMLPGTHEEDATEINVGSRQDLFDFQQWKIAGLTSIRKQDLHALTGLKSSSVKNRSEGENRSRIDRSKSEA